MQELQKFNIHELFKFLQKSDDVFLQWLRDNNLLWSRRFCECGNEMSLYYMKHHNKETNVVHEDRWPIWRCNSKTKHGGKKPTKGFFEGTFFSGAHLGPKQIFEFTYYWCRKTHTHAEFIHDMKLSDRTVCDWKMFCRDVAATYFVNHPQKIGANGATVEIDETVICKPKYHRGKMCAEQVWFFGGIERHSGRCFMKEVERRDAATLLREKWLRNDQNPAQTHSFADKFGINRELSTRQIDLDQIQLDPKPSEHWPTESQWKMDITVPMTKTAEKAKKRITSNQ